jgi:hypothetical protein
MFGVGRHLAKRGGGAAIEAHPTQKGGLYVAATRYKLDDFKPYLSRGLALDRFTRQQESSNPKVMRWHQLQMQCDNSVPH